MGKWTVYSSDGKTIRATTKSLEYNGEYMGECSVTISFESKKPIPFEIGDYIDYREERFYLNVQPAAKKQCSVDGSKDAFVYDNVKFNSPIDELVRCNFLDYVENDNNIHWTALPTFSFYCSSVYDLASRIKANLDRTYGEGVWKIKVNSENVTWKDFSISISDQSVWDALSLVDKNFKTNFIIRGRTIEIGSSGTGIAHTFKYGVGNGLKSFERTIDDNQKVITRLRAYGNTTNMPSSYYKYLSMYIVPQAIEISTATINDTKVVAIKCSDKWATDKLSYTKFYTNIKDAALGKGDALLQIRYTNSDVENIAYASVGFADFVVWYSRDDKFYSFVEANKNKNIRLEIFGTVSLNFNYILSTYPSAVNHDNYPNNMAVTRLMLPDFSIKAGEKDCSYVSKEYDGYKMVITKNDAYIDSPQLSKLGLREGTVYIDGTDNETTDYDVYPSLEGMTAKELNDAGIKVYLSPNDNGNLDEISTASEIKDNGDSDFNKDIAAVAYVWIKDIGFNLKNYLTTETPTIYMKSGMCVGREFEISNIVEENNGAYTQYKLTISRKTDDDLNIVYPNSQFPIKSGDKFVLLHIKMPDIYYQAASQRLLKYALAYFKENDKTRFAYNPEIDNVWMARQHDEATEKGEKSIYQTIKEGDKFMFDEEEDMGIKGNIFINTLKITESDNSLIPEFEITLLDKKSSGSLQRTLSQLSQSFGGGSGDGLSIDQVKTILRESGQGFYLSKQKNDEANGMIAFNSGVETFASESTVAANGIIEYPTNTSE